MNRRTQTACFGLILLLCCGTARAPTLAMRAFNAGEWAPKLAGRQDVAKYYAAVREMTNMVPLTQGPARKRAGTYYIATGSGAERILGFEFSSTQARVLKFGDKTMQVFK